MGAAITVLTLAHLVVPVYFLYLLFRTKLSSRLHATSLTWMVGAYLVLLWRGGAGWDWFGYYLPYIFMAAFITGTFVVMFRARALPWAPSERRPWFTIAFFTLIGAFLAQAIPSTLTAREYPADKAVALAFPLRGGTFHISHGGSNVTMNNHVNVRAQSYALDISALNTFGTRAEGLFPEDVQKYEIYGAEVLAPCSGEIIRARDGLPDQKPGDGDIENLEGNHVVLHCDGVSIEIAHLMPESVTVKTGDRVEAGQPLGQVGNSGNSSEPHLHIHAVSGRQTDPRMLGAKGEPRPMLFDGRFLVRNDRVTKD